MSYNVWIEPSARDEARKAPGNVRQRLKRAMLAFKENPRPVNSSSLDWPEMSFDPRRLRIDQWRIIYAVDDTDQWVWVLAIRKRPPYDYGDLAELLADISD